MQTSAALHDTRITDRQHSDVVHSAVSWPAIMAGALTAAAASLILLILGSGLGLASLSPWTNSGISVATFTTATIIGLIAVQLISSGLGGYLTGRLRSQSIRTHVDEGFFRDTAHGFLSWALATIITAAFLASAVTSIMGGSVKAATTVAAGAAAGAGYDTVSDPTAYFVDSLYRSDPVSSTSTDVRMETMGILINAARNGAIEDADRNHLSALVAAKTGLAAPEARQRVDEVLMEIEEAKVSLKEEADKARKAASKASIFTFLSLLIGAFIASAMASVGGKHRDEY